MQTSQEYRVVVDAAQLESNTPGEDRFCIRERNNKGVIDRAYAVIDGHGGYLAADMTLTRLLDDILDGVGGVAHPRSPPSITDIINACFTNLDSDILNIVTRSIPPVPKVPTKSTHGFDQLPSALCRAGCCVVVVMIIDSMLYVAHVGDCRAILLKRRASIEDRASIDTPLLDSDIDSLEELASRTSRVQHISPQQSQNVSRSTNLNRLDGGLTTVDLMRSQLAIESLQPVLSSEILPVNGCDSSLEAFDLSVDHTSQSAAEVEIVCKMTSDRDPFRCSRNDKVSMRVAGSLSVTRALGDGYLKCKSLSMSPFAAHVPYITATPSISYRQIYAEDTFIVLASDGLWNFISSVDCLNVLQNCCVTEDSIGATSHVADVGIGGIASQPIQETDTVIGLCDQQHSLHDAISASSAHPKICTKRRRDESDIAELPNVRDCEWKDLRIDSHESRFVSDQGTLQTSEVDRTNFPCLHGYIPNKDLVKGPFTVFSSRNTLESSSNANPTKQSRGAGIIRKKNVDEILPLSSGPASELICRCIEAAASDAGLCPLQLLDSCGTSSQGKPVKAPRKFIDDVTVVVLQLFPSLTAEGFSRPCLSI